MLHVDYIDNFEARALDAIGDLSADAERVDIAVAFLSYRGWVELKPSLAAVVGRGRGPERRQAAGGRLEAGDWGRGRGWAGLGVGLRLRVRIRQD
jgi:hypothetical protein